MDEQEVWGQQEGESNLWYDRFMRFLLMGPSRSKLGAVHLEEEEANAKAELSGRKRKMPSKKVPGAWDEAAKAWKWKERAEAYDEYRRKKIFTQGNAYDVHRVERLDHYSQRLEQKLDGMLKSLPDTPEKPWFNNFLYQGYLDTLEALAQETGGRVQKQELSVTTLPKVYLDLREDEDGVDP